MSCTLLMHLTFEHATKFYGPVIGVNDFSCRVGPGVTALFGANGAGKSTMMKLASGQLRPSLGRVLVGEHAAWSTPARRHVGYSPDINNFYEEMTGREFVDTLARLNGFTPADARERTESALRQVGMEDRAERRLAGYSHGMRQRIKLAQALVHDPDILLLDEPMTGIDPQGRRDIFDLLRRQADRGKAVLVSTHLLAQVEDLADTVLMIARGRIIAFGSLAEIRGLLEDEPLTVGIVSEQSRRLGALLIELPDVRCVEIEDDALQVRTANPGPFFAALGDFVAKHAIEVRRLETLDSGADAVFSYLERR